MLINIAPVVCYLFFQFFHNITNYWFVINYYFIQMSDVLQITNNFYFLNILIVPARTINLLGYFFLALLYPTVKFRFFPIVVLGKTHLSKCCRDWILKQGDKFSLVIIVIQSRELVLFTKRWNGHSRLSSISWAACGDL